MSIYFLSWNEGTEADAHLVLIHQGWQHCEGGACLCHDCNCNCCAHTILPLLDLQVVQQCDQNILGAYGLGNIAKGVDSRSADALLVSLEHLQQLKADTHPLSRRHKLSATVCYTTDQVLQKKTTLVRPEQIFL